ncbi:hypothetical protein Rs2_16063 [Raphanus sativus]|nr:hypothetical protein Rs2_16063 [Raphanus sativus]
MGRMCDVYSEIRCLQNRHGSDSYLKATFLVTCRIKDLVLILERKWCSLDQLDQSQIEVLDRERLRSLDTSLKQLEQKRYNQLIKPGTEKLIKALDGELELADLLIKDVRLLNLVGMENDQAGV